jgi:hypothetical protein
MLQRTNIQTLGTIFHQDWWMEAVTDGAWGKAEIKQAERVVGIWPYAIRRRFRTTRLDMPPYARVLGPVLNLPESKMVTRLDNACEVLTDLYSALPPHDLLRHRMAPEYDESIALILCGRQIEQDCTFRLSPTVSQETVLFDMKRQPRAHIKQSQTKLAINRHYDLDQFLALARAQAASQGGQSFHHVDLLIRLFEICAARDQAVILAAKEGSETKAIAVLLFDAHAVYFWLGARKVEESNRGYTYLVWEAFRFAHVRGLTFDLDGFYSPTAARFLRAFGAIPVARPWVVFHSKTYRALMLGRDAWQSLVRRGKG